MKRPESEFKKGDKVTYKNNSGVRTVTSVAFSTEYDEHVYGMNNSPVPAFGWELERCEP